MIVELILFFLIIAMLRLFVFKSRTEKLLEKIPGPKPYPIIGNVLEFLLSDEDQGIQMQKMAEKYGPVYLLRIGSESLVCLSDPQDVETVLTDRRIVHKPEATKAFRPWVETGLFTSEGEEWRKQRRILTPTFASTILQSFISVFGKGAKDLVKNLSKTVGTEIDVVPLAASYSFDTIIETALNHDNVAEKQKVMEAIDELTVIIAQKALSLLQSSPLFPFLKVGKRHDQLIRFCHGVTEKIITERKVQIIPDNTSQIPNGEVKQKRPFLDHLLHLKSAGADLTDKDIRMQVDTFMVAGYDTTQSAVSFALYCLSQNQQVQEMAYREARDILGEDDNDDREPTYQQLQQMKYLEKVINESLRLYSTTRVVLRKTQEEIHLPSGYTLPKQSSIFVMAHVMHTDAKLFPEPSVFDPERFEERKFHPFAFIPFGGGQRECIGKRFAMLSMKSVLSRVLLNFQLLPSATPIVPCFDIIMRSSTGVHLKVERRVK